jgi:hypothetical protein
LDSVDWGSIPSPEDNFSSLFFQSDNIDQTSQKNINLVEVNVRDTCPGVTKLIQDEWPVFNDAPQGAISVGTFSYEMASFGMQNEWKRARVSLARNAVLYTEWTS